MAMSELSANRPRTAESWPRHVQKAKKRHLSRKQVARDAQAARDRADNRRL